jgi:glycosyltransferase involved in cell wall biosynthesis
VKILNVNKYDTGGGAATACERLHRSLLNQGVDSWFLCEVPTQSIPNTVGVRKGNGRGRFYDRLRARARFEIQRFQRPPFFVEPSCHSTCSLNFTKNRLVDVIRQIKPDIVHLHWVGSGFLRIEDLSVLASEFPVVWTLHDMWPFCGAEHVAYTDERWKSGYTKENRDPLAKGPDLNRWVWNRKRKSWSGLTIHTVGVSSWMNESIKESRLFNKIAGHRRVIFNGLDESIFRPPVNNSKEGAPLINPKRSYRIAFGATTQGNPIKGGDLLLEALQKLSQEGLSMVLMTFGKGELQSMKGTTIKNYGRIDSPSKLASIYATADLTLVPSRLESFGQVAAESLACGTPVVCFDTSGLRDIVDHKVNGYRARCYDPADLAEGIRWCMEDKERHAALRRSARETALKRFRISEIADKTITLYDEILSSQ